MKQSFKSSFPIKWLIIWGLFKHIKYFLNYGIVALDLPFQINLTKNTWKFSKMFKTEKYCRILIFAAVTKRCRPDPAASSMVQSHQLPPKKRATLKARDNEIDLNIRKHRSLSFFCAYFQRIFEWWNIVIKKFSLNIK